MWCGIILYDLDGIFDAKGIVIVGTVGTCGLVVGSWMTVGALQGVMP